MAVSPTPDITSQEALSPVGEGSAVGPLCHAIVNLRDCQTQLDADGCMVGVSRQAVDEALGITLELLEAAKVVLAGLEARIAAARDETPVFAGIAALHDAIARAEGL